MINAMDILYCTGIYLAAQNGQKDIVKYLSEELNYRPSKDVYKFTTFYLAAQNGLLDVIKQFMNENFSSLNVMQVKFDLEIIEEECNSKSNHNLINNVFDNFLNIDIEDKDGNSCVHHAAMEGNEIFLNHLIERGASLRAMNSNKDRPIHLAARNGCNNIIKILVEQGVNINVLNKNNDTPLHYAVQNKHTIVVKELLKFGAKNLRNIYGYLPIHYSSSEEIDILLKQDSDNDYKDASDNTLLHIAVINEHCDIMKKIIQLNVNIDEKNKDGNTALHLAAGHGQEIAVKILIENRASTISLNKILWTPCHVAFDKKHDVVALLLLEAAGDSISKPCNLIHIAAKNGCKKLIEMLIKKGFYSTDLCQDFTPLMWAARCGHAKICELFLDYDDTNIIDCTNKFERTALHYAVANNKVEVVNILLKYDAKLLDDDEDIAKLWGFEKIEEILTKHKNAKK